MHAQRNQRVAQFFKLGHKLGDAIIKLLGNPYRLGARQLQRHRLALDSRGQGKTLLIIWRQSAETIHRRLQVAETFVQIGLHDWRRQIADQRRSRTTFGDRTLGRIICGVQVEVRQITNQALGPALVAHAHLLAGHKLECAVGAKIQQRMHAGVFAQVAIERTEGVGRRMPFFKQQPHRIAFIAKRRLHGDDHVAKARAHHEDAAPVGQNLARCRPPLRFQFFQIGLAAHIVVDRNLLEHIGLGAVLLAIAVKDGTTQCIDAVRHLDLVARSRELLERVEQRLKDGQKRRGARRAGVGRKVEQNDANGALGAFGASQGDQTINATHQRINARFMRHHVARALGTSVTRATSEQRWGDSAVQLGNRHHHGGLDRQQTSLGLRPLVQRLKLTGVGRDIRHIQCL